jgi:hypothetical protein
MANLSAFGGAQPITPGGLVELGYDEITSNVTVSSTTEASGTTVIPAVTVVSDGSPLDIEFSSARARVTGHPSGNYIVFNVVIDGTTQGRLGVVYSTGSASLDTPVHLKYRATLSAGAHTVAVTAFRYLADCTIQATGHAVTDELPTFLRVSKIVQQNDGLKPFWTPPITASLPSNPDTGDQIIYKHGGTGNIGSHLPMIYDGTKWQPVGEAVLCRWNSGSATQVFSSTSVTNVTVGDYNTVTFTPPWDGYYEISQKTGMWELNSGIGMQTMFSATDGSANYALQYIQDWNGPYQHHREGHGMPITYYLYSAKTYRFTANITYASGNTGTINFYGTAHVRALSR